MQETSSKKSNTTNTSKVLKRYLTSGTNDGTSSEYLSENTSSILRSSLHSFKKTQSVMYEDSSFIIKKLLSMNKRKTTYGSGTPQEGNRKSISKFLKVGSLADGSSQSSSSPGSFSRHLDRTSDKNRIFIGEDNSNHKHEPILEEALEEEEENLYNSGSELIKRVQSNTVKLNVKKLDINQ